MIAAFAVAAVVATLFSGTWINAPYWVVALQCHGYTECYAASNGSYTPHVTGARRFDDPAKAEEFIGTFTTSLREKSPEIQQRFEPVCVARAGEVTGQPPDCGPAPE